MVLGYIPNLGHGKGKTKRQTSTMRLQDEHDCLALITKQIIQIQTNSGFWTEVMGKKVCVKVWIHFITGDTSGHNNLVGHMNASNMKFPYRDCKCQLLNFPILGQNVNLSPWKKLGMPVQHLMERPHCRRKQLEMHSTMFGLAILNMVY